jgi:hypothetical protein
MNDVLVREGRIADWRSLLASRQPIDGGGPCRVRTPSVRVGDVTRHVAAERNGCQFFRFAITVDTRWVALEVRGPDDAAENVESILGIRCDRHEEGPSVCAPSQGWR